MLEPVRIVAFDFDGTLLEGHSPVRLVRRLFLRRIIKLPTALKTFWWGARYKLHIPVEQAEVRENLFRALNHITAAEANKIMSDFYYEDLRPRLRPLALEVLRAHKETGAKIVLVSASFFPILTEVAKDVKADYFVSTQMKVKDGFYTGNVASAPPEGAQKIIQLAAWADDAFAKAGWVLTHAYGDHRSDAPLLAAAQEATAVNPDSSLTRVAKRENWHIVDWSFKVKSKQNAQGL